MIKVKNHFSIYRFFARGVATPKATQPRFVLYTQNKQECITVKTFFTATIKAKERIGPHKQEIIDIIVGSLLGDGWGEKRNNSTRFHFHVSSRNAQYLDFLHNLFLKNGYCSDIKPKKKIQVGKNGKKYYSIKMRTFSFTSFNEIYDMFYPDIKKKVVPKNIAQYLTGRALVIWVMDNGSEGVAGTKISVESFSLKEIETLQSALFFNFGLQYTIQTDKQWHVLYLSKKSQLKTLAEIIKASMVPSMLYKIRETI